MRMIAMAQPPGDKFFTVLELRHLLMTAFVRYEVNGKRNEPEHVYTR